LLHSAVLIVLFLLGVGSAVAQSTPDKPGPAAVTSPRRLALVGGMLIDGYAVPPVHRAAIVIEDNRITAVGPASEIRVPPETTVIDTSGRTMLPGLIDVHVHLAILGHGDYDRWLPWILEHDYVERVMEISARQLLDSGVTTAVDLGAPLKEILSIRDRIDRGELAGPRMFVSGPWITKKVGRFAVEHIDAIQRLVRSPQEAAAAADLLIDAGVDVIKAHAGLTAADYRAIVDAAHARRVRVHAHLYDEQDVLNALEAGVDVLSHVGSAGMAPPYADRTVAAIVSAGRPVVITATHRSWIFPDTVAYPERLDDPRLVSDFKAIPGLWEEIHESLSNFQTLPYFARIDREIFFRERGLRQFTDSGAIVGMGTDSGTPMNFHTEALWREMKAHVDLGMSPQQVIMAATRVNAREIIGIDDRGTVEPGNLADVIVVDGNPLYDVTALARVDVVIKNGVVHKNRPGHQPDVIDARPSTGPVQESDE